MVQNIPLIPYISVPFDIINNPHPKKAHLRFAKLCSLLPIKISLNLLNPINLSAVLLDLACPGWELRKSYGPYRLNNQGCGFFI